VPTKRPKTKLPTANPLIVASGDCVEWGYRVFLGREPESAEVVASHLEGFKGRPLRELGSAFSSGTEFLAKFGRPSSYRPEDLTTVERDLFPPEVADRVSDYRAMLLRSNDVLASALVRSFLETPSALLTNDSAAAAVRIVAELRGYPERIVENCVQVVGEMFARRHSLIGQLAPTGGRPVLFVSDLGTGGGSATVLEALRMSVDCSDLLGLRPGAQDRYSFLMLKERAGLLALHREVSQHGRVSAPTLFKFFLCCIQGCSPDDAEGIGSVDAPYSAFADSPSKFQTYLKCVAAFCDQMRLDALKIDSFREACISFIADLSNRAGQANSSLSTSMIGAIKATEAKVVGCLPADKVRLVVVLRDSRDHYVCQRRQGVVQSVGAFIASRSGALAQFTAARQALGSEYHFETVRLGHFVQSAEYRENLCERLGIEPPTTKSFLVGDDIGGHEAWPDQAEIAEVQRHFESDDDAW